jgi:hypothetical protein
MHCNESFAIPLDDLHISSRQRFRADLAPGSFKMKRPGRHPLLFNEYVAEYYQRQLSYPSDVLDAMVGIFKSFEEQPGKRRTLNASGIPIFPPGVQGLAVKTLLHSFLCGLLWYHLTPGKRRVQFPSWSWAGWQAGTLNPEPFTAPSPSCSLLQADTAVWFEEDDTSLREFSDIVHLPDGMASYQYLHFIHLDISATVCYIVRLVAQDLPHPNLSPGLYAKYLLNDSSFGYAKLYLSDASKEHSYDSNAPLQEYLGLILPFTHNLRTPGQANTKQLQWTQVTHEAEKMFSVLMIEQHGHHYERVGCFHVWAIRDWVKEKAHPDVNLVEDEKKTLRIFDKDYTELAWDKQVSKTKQHIRLG